MSSPKKSDGIIFMIEIYLILLENFPTTMPAQSVSEFSLTQHDAVKSCISIATERWLKLKQRLWAHTYPESRKAPQDTASSRQSVLLFLGGSQVISIIRNFLTLSSKEDTAVTSLLDEIENICLPKFMLLYERFKFFTLSDASKGCLCEFAQDLKRLSESCEFYEMTDSYIDARLKELIVKKNSKVDRKKRNIDLNVVCQSSPVCKAGCVRGQVVVANKSSNGLAGNCPVSAAAEKKSRPKINTCATGQRVKRLMTRCRRTPMRTAKAKALLKSFDSKETDSDDGHNVSVSSMEENEMKIKDSIVTDAGVGNLTSPVPRVFVNILARPGPTNACWAKVTTSSKARESGEDEGNVSSTDEGQQTSDCGQEMRGGHGPDPDLSSPVPPSISSELENPSNTNGTCVINVDKPGAQVSASLSFTNVEQDVVNETICSPGNEQTDKLLHISEKLNVSNNSRLKVFTVPSTSNRGENKEKQNTFNMKFVHVTNSSTDSKDPVKISVRSDLLGVSDVPKRQPALFSSTVLNGSSAPNGTTRMLKCDFCSTLCANKKILKAHMQTNHGISVSDSGLSENEEETTASTLSVFPLTCGQCGERFKYQSQLDMHEEEQHGKNACTCKVCSAQFLHLHALGRHFLKMHLTEVFVDGEEKIKEGDRFCCKVCSKSFLQAHNLKRHFLRAHLDVVMLGDPGGVCSVCGKTFKSSNLLVRHEAMHSLQRIPCNICGAKFISQKKCDHHKEIRHSETSLQKPFICEVCGKAFRFQCLLRYHSRKHCSEKPFQCGECSESFKEKKTLELHVKVHRGDPPFKCPTCQEAFIHKEPFLNHTRKHSGEKPFVCSQCGKSFRIQPALSAHMKTHDANRPRPYKCSLCGYTCERRYFLVKHSLKHSGLKPYKCPVCHAGFTAAYGRNKHLRRTHGVLNPKAMMMSGEMKGTVGGQSPLKLAASVRVTEAEGNNTTAEGNNTATSSSDSTNISGGFNSFSAAQPVSSSQETNMAVCQALRTLRNEAPPPDPIPISGLAPPPIGSVPPIRTVPPPGPVSTAPQVIPVYPGSHTLESQAFQQPAVLVPARRGEPAVTVIQEYPGVSGQRCVGYSDAEPRSARWDTNTQHSDFW
ncbi:uncharacterized protein LOC101864572 [Aplysia californica]|uniref:Uncharacterized protein LOC101864572 n=1 Tax=Aplysia californica TaxID=6500 RepID=A0ABM0K8J0_APLCA|nr:uncharacterized protein LOC101864572 [Aplysia californica]